MKKFIAMAAVLPLLAGCFNLATRSNEITGAYTSPLKYTQHTCDQLATEVGSLARRENSLVAAQEQRRKSGKVQAFWLGYGTGDGIEASELATVRGEKEAARTAMEQKRCDSAAYQQQMLPSVPSGLSQPAMPAPAPVFDATPREKDPAKRVGGQ